MEVELILFHIKQHNLVQYLNFLVKSNYLYLTELAMVTNQLCWEHYGKGESKLMELYADYYYKVRDYAYDNLTGDELQHYYEVTD